MAQWHYVDTAGRQVGPVDAEAVRTALQSGAATRASLAWREGLAGWQPIEQLAGELGIAGEAPPTAPPAPLRAQSNDANPYRAPESESGENRFDDSGEVVYAGFWRRWAALVLDQLIIGLPLGIVYFFVGLAVGITGDSQPNPMTAIVLQLVFYAVQLTVAFFYYAGLESSEAQATFGKRALGIKVTDLSGHRISFRHAAGRWFAAAISYMTMSIGFLMAAFTQRKQALHDIVASTLVVDRWAYTPSPERQQRGLGGCAIVFMVVIAAMIVMFAVAAVVAVTQFQKFQQHQVGAAYATPTVTVCVEPASSTYVARCLPPSFEA